MCRGDGGEDQGVAHGLSSAGCPPSRLKYTPHGAGGQVDKGVREDSGAVAPLIWGTRERARALHMSSSGVNAMNEAEFLRTPRLRLTRQEDGCPVARVRGKRPDHLYWVGRGRVGLYYVADTRRGAAARRAYWIKRLAVPVTEEVRGDFEGVLIFWPRDGADLPAAFRKSPVQAGLRRQERRGADRRCPGRQGGVSAVPGAGNPPLTMPVGRGCAAAGKERQA